METDPALDMHIVHQSFMLFIIANIVGVVANSIGLIRAQLEIMS